MLIGPCWTKPYSSKCIPFKTFTMKSHRSAQHMICRMVLRFSITSSNLSSPCSSQKPAQSMPLLSLANSFHNRQRSVLHENTDIQLPFIEKPPPRVFISRFTKVILLSALIATVENYAGEDGGRASRVVASETSSETIGKYLDFVYNEKNDCSESSCAVDDGRSQAKPSRSCRTKYNSSSDSSTNIRTIVDVSAKD